MEGNKLIAQQLTEIWKDLCHLHNELYQMTCHEYSLLLDSKIEELETAIENKNLVISNIDKLNNIRIEYIEKIETINNTSLTNNFKSLIQFFKNSHIECEFLEKYNNLLVNIIEQLREQNIINQKFINKAMISLNQIKNELTNKSPITYDSSGLQQKSL